MIGDDTNEIKRINPIRYRSYYYDTETGFYYLNARYYDPEIGRFINADLVSYLGIGDSLKNLNLFTYCENNPVARIDSLGFAWETIWDAISLAAGLAELAATPYDPWAWIRVAGDTADLLIPFVGGIGETTRVFKAASRAMDTLDDVADTAKIAKKGWKVGDDITALTRTGTVPKWETLRKRYWKNKVHFFGDDSVENANRMKKGLAPRFVDDQGNVFSMELHHFKGRENDNFYLFFEITPEGHAKIDKFRHL